MGLQEQKVIDLKFGTRPNQTALKHMTPMRTIVEIVLGFLGLAEELLSTQQPMRFEFLGMI